jgi:hypothetical protein
MTIDHGDNTANADRDIGISQLTRLLGLVGIGRAVAGAVTGDLDDHVTDSDRYRGIDQSRLRRGPVGALGVAVTGRIAVHAGVNGTERHRR